MNSPATRRIRRKDRRGAAAVEFAVTVPLFFFILFSSLEFSRVNTVRTTIDTAAYEGVRRGIVPGAAVSDVRTATLDTLASVLVRDAVVDVQPTTITDETPEVTVTVTVPLASNFWVAPIYFRSGSLTSTLTLQRERLENTSAP